LVTLSRIALQFVALGLVTLGRIALQFVALRLIALRLIAVVCFANFRLAPFRTWRARLWFLRGFQRGNWLDAPVSLVLPLRLPNDHRRNIVPAQFISIDCSSNGMRTRFRLRTLFALRLDENWPTEQAQRAGET
jgi:hypothetical protein